MSAESSSSRLALPTSPGAVLGVILAVVCAGCVGVMFLYYWYSPAHDINDTYGKRRGYKAVDSVNGTAVLASMFEASGRSVNSISEIGPRVERYDTIVWVPNRFTVPGDNVQQFLENWLANKPNRTLIYIGRDHDSSPEYWQRVMAQVPPEDREEYERRWANAQARVHAQQTAIPHQQRCDWFIVQGNEPRRRIDSLDGPWAEEIDTAKTEIDLGGRLDIPPSSTGQQANAYGSRVDILLQSENDILAHAYTPNSWNKSKVIVVANGSFTLNMPLVNKEHRKLAGRLIAETSAGSDVAFLESGPQDPVVRKVNDGAGGNHALHLFTIWPISFIVVHLAALGLAYSIYRFPMFGRPQRLPPEQRADFGQHVTALGELLRRTGNVANAEQRIAHYQQQARRSSGKSHISRTATVDVSPVVSENKGIP
jgi:hypothetical protein